jgi:branched-chain amino acid aminotransferase
LTFRITRLNRPGLDLADRGFLLGDGVFDTMGSQSGAVFRLEEHRRRLLGAAELIGLPLERAALVSLQDEVLEELGARAGVVRTTVSRGSASRGLWPAAAPEPTVLVTAEPWPTALIGRPVRLHVASVPRNDRSALSRIKSLSALETVLAAREAALAGCDEALLLNSAGRVACSSVGNVFALFGDTLATPPPSEGCLAGIMRGAVLELAGALDLAVREAPITLEALLAADGAAVTNALRLVRPVTAVGDSPLSRSAKLDALARQVEARVFNRTFQP